jgi:4a-hydroxytetrahydrobiopterin dehydratase
MRLPKLSAEQVDEELQQLPCWQVRDAKLHREFKFADFIHAFGFMATASMAIEKLNHHPEWLNVYNRVVVDLVTHDSGGITKNDLELARVLDRIAAKLQ